MYALLWGRLGGWVRCVEQLGGRIQIEENGIEDMFENVRNLEEETGVVGELGRDECGRESLREEEDLNGV